MQQKKILPWHIGATYIGTVIGAGFATGREILQFFTCFGPLSIITVLLSGAAFILLAYGIFYIAKKLHTYNYKDFIYSLCGNKMGFFYDLLITVFFFLGTSVMFSGSGALFAENLGIPAIVGVVLIALLTLAVVLQSLQGISKANAVIMPILILVVGGVLIGTIAKTGLGPLSEQPAGVYTPNIFKAVFAFVFYCAYNTVMCVGVLTAYSGEVKDLGTLKRGALWGGTGLMLMALSLNICLLLNSPQVFDYSIPMLYIIRDYHPLIKYALMLCIWCEIFSTSIANVFSLASRICRTKPRLYKPAALFLVIACIPLALVDFKKLISTIYPLFGALSIFLILQMLYFLFTSGEKKHFRLHIAQSVDKR